MEFAHEQELNALLRDKLAEKGRIVLAIDGRCGAGKSTLADRLAAQCNGRVIRADDFFLRPEQRTPERLAEPGGTPDRARMREGGIAHLRDGALRYTPFDCQMMALGEPLSLPAAEVTIVEGAYSLHPCFGPYYDLAVFVTADQETRLARIGARKGHNNVENFRTRWIPMEERYLAAFGIEERADLIIDTGR